MSSTQKPELVTVRDGKTGVTIARIPAGVAAGIATETRYVFLSNLFHAYAQTDGSYAFPNSREGDMLKQAKKEIEALQAELRVARAFYAVAVKERDAERLVVDATRSALRVALEDVQKIFEHSNANRAGTAGETNVASLARAAGSRIREALK